MDGEAALKPLMAQYEAVKAEHKNEVLFFRLGDFYEMFNGDAVEISRLLNLTLTHRGGAPMCGIPYHAAKIYIARLLRLGKKIAICEQVGEVPRGKGLTERKVVEVITPGTAVDSEYLGGSANNFLAAMSVSRGKAGFAFIDITTSRFEATSWAASDMASRFSKELGRVCPRELLLPQSMRAAEAVSSALQSFPGLSVSFYPDWDFSEAAGFKRLCAQFKTASLRPFSLSEDSPEVPPAGFLLDYLEKTTGAPSPHVRAIKVYGDSDYLVIDDSSRRNLEITANLRDGGSKFCLLECVDRAKTAMGSRMTRQWLLYPLIDARAIKARQDRVELFARDRALLCDTREALDGTLDIERLAARVAMERAHPKDLRALMSSLERYLRVRSILAERDFSEAGGDDAKKIISLIQSAILDDPSTSLTEGNIIRRGWSEELDKWRDIHDNFGSALSEYEAEERAKTGISSLKIKNTGASGYFIEVSKSKLQSVPAHFIMRRALVSGDRYTTETLQGLERKLNESGSKILEMERDLFVEVRSRLRAFVPYLMRVASDIAYTDVCASLAETAIVLNWTRPEVDDSGDFHVSLGRHPVVELHMPSGEFVGNDLDIKAGGESFALVTGPNMAGKSTYLRQNALIALLAQTGSFVPAREAKIGIVDRIFCRVGASDNLARGESTFLVEMTETANILRCATEKSLVIMDEVGRGTSTEDGLAIAQAVAEHLMDGVKCRALFATHFHELTRMENPAMRKLRMDVSDTGGGVVFLRKVREGASENSYGLHVARLAGVPDSVIDRASEILERIQSTAAERPIIQSEKAPAEPAPPSPGLFSDEEITIGEILSADTDNMTPMAALETIARWRRSLSGR